MFVSSQDIILKDDETGTETNLKLNPYTFTAAAGSTNARFSLKYQKTLRITASTVNNNGIVLFNKNEKIVIKSDSSLINNVKIYDVSGKLLYEKSNVKAIETSIDSSKFIGQLLIVKIVSDNNTVVNRKIVV